MSVPIIIICFNNYKYVDNTINQLLKINSTLQEQIIIVDNKSTCEETINYLKFSKCKVRYNDKNNGPSINPHHNADLFYELPDFFILTDPDLELNPNLPENFIDILVNLSKMYGVEKIGCALDISQPEELINSKNYTFYNNYSFNIVEWEQRFWYDRLENKEYELYRADIDTTFCLVNKNGFDKIRIAGNFTAKHLPWYKDNKLFNIYENYSLNKKTTSISTTSKIIIEYIENNYIKVDKNDIYFFIKNDISDSNLDFWKNHYSSWKNNKFQVFDRFLNKDKIFIDIGAWIGATCIYASRKSKHIFAIEPDINSNESLSQNCKNNCNNYTIINKSISNTTDIDTKTITIQDIITEYNIDIQNISLINVDIEGYEEDILNDLYEIHTTHNIPLYISFYYNNWNNNDIDRFVFLTEEQKNIIKSDSNISILFNQT